MSEQTGPEPPGASPGRSIDARWRLLLAAAILVGAVAFVWVVVDWRRLLAIIVRADPLLVGAGIVAAVGGIACWGEAMRLLLPESARPLARRRGFLVYATGGLVRNALPVGYAGSIAVLAYVFRREAALPMDRALATVSVAELVNATASVLVTVTGVLLLLRGAPEVPLVRWLGVLTVGLAVAAAAAGAAVWYRRATAKRVVHAAAVLLARAVSVIPGTPERRLSPTALEAALEEYYQSLAVVSDRRRAVGLAFGLSLAGWLATVSALYLAGLAVGYRVPAGLALFVVPMGGYATVLPVPGGLGGFEVGVTGLLHLLGGVDIETALAATLLFRLCAYWVVVGVGAVASSYLAVDVRTVAASATGADPGEADHDPDG